MLSFSYDLIESLNDEAYLDKYKLVNDFEKRQHFFDLLEKERKRIVNIIIGKDMTDLRKETDIIDEAIRSGNPYED